MWYVLVILLELLFRKLGSGPSLVGFLNASLAIWCAPTVRWCSPYDRLPGQPKKTGRNQSLESVITKQISLSTLKKLIMTPKSIWPVWCFFFFFVIHMMFSWSFFLSCPWCYLEGFFFYLWWAEFLGSHFDWEKREYVLRLKDIFHFFFGCWQLGKGFGEPKNRKIDDRRDKRRFMRNKRLWIQTLVTTFKE